MLLSHNFDISPDVVPALSREEFFEVFRSGLGSDLNLQCRLLEHAHWTVEILFATPEFSAPQVGEHCAQALVDVRSHQLMSDLKPDILILGGLKTTPPTSDSPDALQPGEWGVDVVETRSSDAFLAGIVWDATVAQRPAQSIFKVVRRGLV
jgi:Protein of unknown function (DUF2656)